MIHLLHKLLRENSVQMRIELHSCGQMILNCFFNILSNLGALVNLCTFLEGFQVVQGELKESTSASSSEWFLATLFGKCECIFICKLTMNY